MDFNETSFRDEAPSGRSSARDRKDPLGEAALEAAKLIAPIWPLKDFVAVNPMQGMASTAFVAASRELQRAIGDDLLMPKAYYREALDDGRLTDAALAEALDVLGWSATLSPEQVREALRSDAAEPHPALLPSFADALSEDSGEDWSGWTVDQISFWAGTYFDQGQALWKNPFADRPPFAAWRAYAGLDRSADAIGIEGFREAVRALPVDPHEVLERTVKTLCIRKDAQQAYFHRLLSTVAGWGGHLRYTGWGGELAGGAPTGLIELLAIRAAYDLILFERCQRPALTGRWPELFSTAFDDAADPRSHTAEVVAHLALERAYQAQLVDAIAARASGEGAGVAGERPSAQAVFCIDVRSERFRRALESVDATVETFGFAGFFGISMAVEPLTGGAVQPQCPVLLEPQYTVCETAEGPWTSKEAITVRNTALAAWKRFKNAAVSSFSFVEAMGVGFAGALLRDTFLRPGPEREPRRKVSLDHGSCSHARGIDHENRLALAQGMLGGISIGQETARLVLLAGHGATTTNNPYAAGLDCGACGGHAGDSNARVAAAILNDPKVREGLAAAGQPLPEDTVFLAGIHDTVTDDVLILNEDDVPASHADDLARLKARLADAGRITRRERAPELGLPALPDVDEKIRERARDWSQVRPEWGLAGCAAFIAAPRERTLGIDLGGRAFLHSYEWQADADSAILELIMTAPLVVASWINLQYFASTVNNTAFGSGDKTLHNVVGGVGILEGNAGDLRGGLPMQSIHDGRRFYHTPLRLTAVIEAPTAKIDAILEKHGGVADLFNNEWLTLLAIEDEGRRILRYRPGGGWSDAQSPNHIPARKDAA